MANVLTKFARLTTRTASAGGGETRLLGAGVVGTDFQGSLGFAANSLALGDIVRIFAGGTWANNNANNNGTGQLKLYLNPGAAFNNPIADTNTITNLVLYANNATPLEWIFSAELTIQSTGANGTGWCDSILFNDARGWQRMSGSGSFTIDTTQANALDLTGTVTTQGAITLNQCSVEYLPHP
jgi:hypothetical protein